MHYVEDPVLLDDVAYFERTADSISALIVKLVFNRMPDVPASNKWSQLWGCLSWMFKALLLNFTFPKLATASFEKTCYSLLSRASEDAAMHVGCSVEYTMSWHKMNGNRMKQLLNLCLDHTAMIHIIMLTLIFDVWQW